MSEHVISAKFNYDDAGLISGMQRDVEATRQLADEVKKSAPASDQLSQAKKRQADASAAVSRATIAETQAAYANDAATLRLATAKAKLAEQAAATARAEAQLQDTIRRNTAASEEAAAGIGSIESSLTGATQAVKAFIGAWAVRQIISELKELTFEGINFNAQLEQSRLGMGALTMTFGTIYDATGRVLKGNEAYNASMRVGADLQQLMKVRALSTTLQFSDLLEVMQRGMPQMMKHLTDANGFVVDSSKLVDFAATFAQGAKTAGLEANEVGVNIQRFLEGTADPRHARFAAMLLGTIAPTQAAAKEQMQQWEAQGVLFDKLMEKLAAFKQAGQDAMNTYSGALSNLKDAWQQLLGEGTEGATKTMTSDMLALRDALVTVDTQGHATFNQNLIDMINGVAGAMAGLATAGVHAASELTKEGGILDTLRAWREENSRGIGGAILRGATAAATVGLSEPGLLKRVFSAADEATKVRTTEAAWSLTHPDFNPRDWFAMSGKSLGTVNAENWGRVLNYQSSHTGPAPAGFLGPLNDPKSPFNKQDVDSGMAALLGGGWNQTGVKIKVPKGGGDEEDTAAEHKLADFQRWMEEFHTGAAAGVVDDPLSKTLQQMAVQREQALKKVDEVHKQLKDSAENWNRDKADIEATFANRATEATDKYVAEFQSAREKVASKYAPAKQGDYEATNVDAKQSALSEIDDVKRKFPGIAADWSALEAQVTAFYKTKLVDDANASLKTINDKTLSAVKKTTELEGQIRIDAETETQNRRIELIINPIDRELAARIAANDKWAAEEDKRTQLELAGDTMKGLREQRLAAIEDARTAKNRQAEDAANRARQAMIAGTDEWMNNLEKRRDEVIPKIGLTLQDTVIGALTSTQTAIEKYFADIADGNANLGKSADALVKDLARGWSKVFADALSAPLHGGSAIDSLKQIQGAFKGGTLDQFLAGAGIGSFVGGFFGPGNKAQAGGAIGGGVGGVAGGIIGSVIPGLGTAIGAEIGSVIGSAIGAAIGSTMKTSDHITVALRNLNLDNLRTPGASTQRDNGTLLNLGNGGSIDIDEKGISPEARNDLMIQVKRKVTETMKSYQQIIDLFPDDVKAKLANFHPTLDITGGTGATGNITDEGALTSINDFLSNKLPKATFAAYEPALKAGLVAMGEGQGRIAELMTYWGTMQGTELHDAVLAYVTALVTFAANRTKLGDLGAGMNLGSAQTEARKNENATPLSQLVDANSQMALTVASLPKLTDVSDQLAAMQQLNTMSDSFFSGLVSAFQKIDDLQKGANSSLDKFNESIDLAGMSDQQKMDYYYKQMGTLETQLTTEKDPQKVADLVNQIEQYGQAALGLAPDNAANRDELKKISDEVRNLAGEGFGKAQQDLVAVQKSAFELLNTAANTLLKASGDLTGRGGGTGRDPAAPPGGGPGGDGDPKGPITKPANDTITLDSLSTAFSTALDSKPLAIAADNGVAVLVDAIDRVTSAIGDGGVHDLPIADDVITMRDHYRGLLDMLTQSSKPAPWTSTDTTGGGGGSPAVNTALLEEIRQLRIAVASRAPLVITGDGAEFLRSVGFDFREATIDELRAHPDLLKNVWD